MAINEWWLGDDEERFWVEVTDREALGSNLIAPQLGGDDPRRPTGLSTTFLLATSCSTGGRFRERRLPSSAR